MARMMTGAEMVVQALTDQDVDTVFGYPGGAVLPIYDEIFQQENAEAHSWCARKAARCIPPKGTRGRPGKVGVVLGDIRPRRHERCHWSYRCADG